MKRLFPLLLLCLCFAACTPGEIQTLKFSSPNGDHNLQVNGERESGLGPIIVQVTMMSEEKTTPFRFEHHAGSLTDQNVKAEWKNDQHAVLTFIHDDDASWQVDCFFGEDAHRAVKKFNPNGGLFD